MSDLEPKEFRKAGAAKNKYRNGSASLDRYLKLVSYSYNFLTEEVSPAYYAHLVLSSLALLCPDSLNYVLSSALPGCYQYQYCILVC